MMVATHNLLFDFDETSAVGNIHALTCCKYERVGQWYETYARKRARHHTLSMSSDDGSDSESEASDADFDSDNEDFLRTLDPKQWKEQDHYQVLGLSKIRYKASSSVIRNAYKKKVLVHHPDKRKALGKTVQEDDDYFTCITKAYETLIDPVTKRSFDSVDPQFDDSIPPSDVNATDFLNKYTPVFERNSRWSKSKRVPNLGDDNSSREAVEEFYSFWYSFDSWREYSYLDEEDKDKGSDRYERRLIEQDNKRERKERKKEENARIRQLVDNAYACDPRIQRFKQEDKDRKAAMKRAKQEAAQAKKEEEERQRREAELEAKRQKEEEERIAKEKAAAAKKEKEAAKNALKKEKKYLRNRVKELDYFSDDPTARLHNMEALEKLVESLTIDSMKSLNERLKGDKESAAKAFSSEVGEMNAQIEKEKEKMLGGSKGSNKSSGTSGSDKSWSTEEVQLLIKGVNLFPPGTNDRWEVIASFITQHLPESKRSAKETLSQAKQLQKDDMFQKKAANESAFDRAMKTATAKVPSAAAKQDDPSQRYMSPAETLVMETGENTLPWTPEEQKLLEQALRTYPNGTPDRWDKIAACLKTRSKKDCMLRFKELAEMIKAKKAAEAAAAAKRK